MCRSRQETGFNIFVFGFITMSCAVFRSPLRPYARHRRNVFSLQVTADRTGPTPDQPVVDSLPRIPTNLRPKSSMGLALSRQELLQSLPTTQR